MIRPFSVDVGHETQDRAQFALQRPFGFGLRKADQRYVDTLR